MESATEQKRVYLAGPIFGCTYEQITGWRDESKRVLGKENCFDPFRENFDFRGKEQENAGLLVAKDKLAIRESNTLLANYWQPSPGTAMEILYAYEQGLAVIMVHPELSKASPWLIFHSDYRVPTLEKALELCQVQLR